MTYSNDWLISVRADVLRVREQAANNKEAQMCMVALSAKDLLFWMRHFVWTYDPRQEATPNNLPFILYDFQEEFITRIDSNYNALRDLLVEKSRDMGVSWLCLAWITWRWLFDSSSNVLIGSRKEDLVDNFQLDSLFGKVAYILDHLPTWMLPAGWITRDHRTHMRIVNPATGNTIQGESSNTDFSRQGRYSAIMLDEFAFWDYAGSVWTATADSAPFRLVVSTPKGLDNKFAELRHGGNIDVYTLHWRQHPLKDDEWYQHERERRTTREIAQELDLDYEASGNERVFTILKTNGKLRRNVIIPPFEIPHEMITTDEVGRKLEQPEIRYHWRLYGGLDYGTRSVTSFHVYARANDGVHYSIWEWRKTYQDIIADGFKGSMLQAIASMLKSCPYYRQIQMIYTDPSLWAETVNLGDQMTSIYRQLCDEGITNLIQGAQSDKACIELTLSLWADDDNPQFRIFSDCTGQIEEFEGLMWDDWSEITGIKKSLKETIVDKNNHSWDDYKYYIMSRPQLPEIEKKPYKFDTYGWMLEEQGKLRKQQGKRERYNIKRPLHNI